MREAFTYRGARRNLAKGSVWSSIFHYERPGKPRQVLVDQSLRLPSQIKTIPSAVVAAVAGMKRRI